MKPGAVVLHASGATDPVEAMQALRAAGHPAGTFHPIAPLAAPERAAATLKGGWIGVDGDAPAVAAAECLARVLGARVLRIPPGAKAGYHAAAVFASNFPAVLLAAAEEKLRQLGVEPEAADGAALHLLLASVANVAALGAERALVGPVSRGDAGTVRRNAAALASDPLLQDLYVAASRVALEVARGAGTASVAQFDEVERALAEIRVSPSR